jgi:hypothetical protein
MLRRLLVVSATILILLLSAVSRFNVAKTQALPAPTVDRVGFPTNYQSTFVKLYTFDNFQNRQIRVVWANPIAASVRPSNVYNFPYGSIILFESYSVQEDANGEPMLDGNGRFMQNKLTTLFVMRKEQGFGVDYGLIRLRRMGVCGLQSRWNLQHPAVRDRQLRGLSSFRRQRQRCCYQRQYRGHRRAVGLCISA